MNGRKRKAGDWTAIEAEATRLYLKARESDSEADWKEAYDWVEQDPAHGFIFAKVEASWDLTGRLCESKISIDQEDVAGPAGRFEALFDRRVMAGLIGVALVGAVATVAIQKWSAVDRYRTDVGQERQIALNDGSKLHLNTDTAVEVALRNDERFVHLLRGEARFDVAHNPQRPFIVRAGNVSFRALGTAFNVRFRGDLTELTVLSGKVGVNGEKMPGTTVTAGGYAAIRGRTVGVSQLDQDEVAQHTAWEKGMIQFEGETLEQAVGEFNRYREKPLVIGSQQIAAIRIGGTFRVTNSDQFVSLLESSFHVRAIPGEDGILLMPEEAGSGSHHDATAVEHPAAVPGDKSPGDKKAQAPLAEEGR